MNVSLEETPDFYTDFEKALEFLRNLDLNKYEYPNNISLFHVYTDLNNSKELTSIKSFLATQNLDKSKLIVWSDYDISKKESIAPYKNLLDLRIYERKEEAKDTPLEGCKIHLEARDHRHWIDSGVLRFLLIYKYGGIWFDMDMVLLRDFKPFLNKNFAYMWGSSRDFSRLNPNSGDCYGPCAALIGGIKKSEHTRICLEEMIESQVELGTACFDHELLAKVYRRKKFNVYPSAFFNTEWQVNCKYPGLSQKIQTGWFKKSETSDQYLFPEAFSWHWHNSSRKNEIVYEGSKFNLLEQEINNKLKARGII